MNKKLLLTLSTIVLSTNLIASGQHGDDHSEMKDMNVKHDMAMNDKQKEHKPMHKKIMGDLDQVMTMPTDGQMLMGSPETLMMHFPAMVTLSSVQIMDEANNVLDVNFELSADPVKMFEQTLPTLVAGTYTVKYFYMNTDSEMSIEEFWFMVH
ncbi:MAG: copper resistance protein CopC [Saccharospirillaceae bacterium]|nr:copper resistance protein CopC [Pseudomonadales bacterium]NRB79714.1 copper resistance protein CopC [Saccharospirillaceae bacterium]